MSYLLVEKSPPLSGRVRVDACKNSVLPLMAAALLTPEPVVLVGAPPLSDVHKMAELLLSLGAQVTQEEDHSLDVYKRQAIGRGLPVDRPAQVQVADDGRRAQVKDPAHKAG